MHSKEQYTPEYEFETKPDGENCMILQYKGDRSEVSVPPFINGRKVVGVFGFQKEEKISLFHSEDISTVKKVIIPTTVTVIHLHAFHNCKKLHTVIAHPGIEEIGSCAFLGCTNLRKLDFGMGPIPEGKVMLPPNLKELGEHSLCSRNGRCLFNEVVLSKKTKWKRSFFRENAFDPQSCALFYYEDGYPGSDDLDSREMTENGASESEFLLGSDGTNYVIKSYIGNSRIVVIPPVIRGRKVTKIGTAAFVRLEGRTDVEEILIPETVTEIGDWAFLGNDKLRKVIAHPNVTYIGDWAFLGCENLKIMDFGMGQTQSGTVRFPKKLKKLGARSIASDRGGIPCLFKEVTLSKKTKWNTPYWDLTQPAFQPGSCKVIYYEDTDEACQ